ncbi:MAG: phage holin family protein [Solirubrobacterales bacterium]
MNDFHQERTLGSLFSELTRETSTLFRQEINLAKTEATEKVRQAGVGLAATVAGGLLLFIAVQALAATAVIALAQVVQWWVAALIVALVVALIGALVLSKGIANLRGENLTPRRTIDTLRANGRWAREQLR